MSVCAYLNVCMYIFKCLGVQLASSVICRNWTCICVCICVFCVYVYVCVCVLCLQIFNMRKSQTYVCSWMICGNWTFAFAGSRSLERVYMTSNAKLQKRLKLVKSQNEKSDFKSFTFKLFIRRQRLSYKKRLAHLYLVKCGAEYVKKYYRE